MTRLIVISPNPFPHRKYLILGIFVGIAFIIVAISDAKMQPPMPLYVKITMFLTGIVAIISCFWRLTHDPKLYQNVSRLYKEIKVENDIIIFPKELKLKPGVLECWHKVSTRGGTAIPYGYTFNEA